MFIVNNKNTRTTSLTPFPSVSFVDFEQVNGSWEATVSHDPSTLTRSKSIRHQSQFCKKVGHQFFFLQSLCGGLKNVNGAIRASFCGVTKSHRKLVPGFRPWENYFMIFLARTRLFFLFYFEMNEFDSFEKKLSNSRVYKNIVVFIIAKFSEFMLKLTICNNIITLT